jgi:hypothetical protein
MSPLLSFFKFVSGFLLETIIAIICSIIALKNTLSLRKNSRFLIWLIISYWIAWILLAIYNSVSYKYGEGFALFSAISIYLHEHRVIEIIHNCLLTIFYACIKIMPWGMVVIYITRAIH